MNLHILSTFCPEPIGKREIIACPLGLRSPNVHSLLYIVEKAAVIIYNHARHLKSLFFRLCNKIALAILKGRAISMGGFDEYGKVELGDERLSNRLPIVLEQLAGNPTASISAACMDPYQAKAVYRLLANKNVTTEAITDITRKITIGNIVAAKPSVVLIPEDTTEMNYTNLKATEGLGSIGGSVSLKGLHVHSATAIGESGEIFGLLAQKIWARPHDTFGVAVNRANVPIEDKESYKWLDTMVNAQRSLPEDIFAVHVCDREGDIYEFFCKAAEIKANYLCRKQYNRAIDDENGNKKLDEYMAGRPVAGRITVSVPRDSHTKRVSREAVLEIKHGKCTVPKPRNLAKNNELPDSIEVYVVSAVEINPPKGQAGISWQLVSNVPTESFDEAVTLVRWYTQRWNIETFHRTLKSGCKVEDLQFETAGKLMKLTAIYSIIALHIMHVSHLARTRPEESCEICLTEDEWEILHKVANKTKELPSKPPTIHEAVVMIAKLGGFLGRKSDGFPGVTVIWRGLTKLYTILDAAEFLG